MSVLANGPGDDSITVEATFPSSPARVFRAWTDSEEIKKWFGSEPGELESATVDLRPGGEWRFTERTSAAGSVGFEGHYIEIDPDVALIFSWSKFSSDVSGQRASTPHSRVEVRFAAVPDGTHMTIVHSAIDDEQVRSDFGRGWARALPNLAVVV